MKIKHSCLSLLSNNPFTARLANRHSKQGSTHISFEENTFTSVPINTNGKEQRSFFKGEAELRLGMPMRIYIECHCVKT
jgi:hypothetical protein